MSTTQILKPLKTDELSATLAPRMALNERVRQRLREEKARLKLSDRDLAGVTGWSQAKVSQKLLGQTAITLDELDGLCFGLSLQPSEAVRDRGLEFCAEMTPTELRLLEQIRRLPKPTYDFLVHFLRSQPQDAEQRGATPRKARVPKPHTSRARS